MSLASVVYVSFDTSAIDRSWIPQSVPIIVVHNDDSFAPSRLPEARHIVAPANIGFGAGVNLALPVVTTRRVILCNPDVSLAPVHWDALASASDDEVVTVPLLGPNDTPTVVVRSYPSPWTLILMGYRAGGWLPGINRVRRRFLGSLYGGRPTVRPLTTAWPSAAVLSISTSRMLAVGGFDARYFLYFEDVDLARRLSARFPRMRVRVADVRPGHHTVGASSASRPLTVERQRLEAAIQYSESQSGILWRVTRRALAHRRVAS